MKRFLGKAVATISAASGEFFRHQGVNQAAALAFYTLLSFIPLFFLTISVFGLIMGDTWEAQQYVRLELEKVLPWVDDLLFKRIQRLIWASPGLGWQSLVFIIWSSGLFFSLLRRNLLHPWHADREPARGWRRLLPWLAGPVISVGLLALVILVQFLGYMPYKWLPRSALKEYYWLTMVWGLLCFAFLFLGIYAALLPRIRPLRIAFPLCLSLACAGYGVTWVFSRLLSGLPRYNLVYGSLAGMVLFLLWLNYNLALVLFGGHFIRLWGAEVSRERAGRDRRFRLWPLFWKRYRMPEE